jgi:hypothetical protein
MINTVPIRRITEIAIMNLYRSGIIALREALECMPSRIAPPARIPRKDPKSEVKQEKNAT